MSTKTGLIYKALEIHLLCEALPTNNEKNWGCFARNPDRNGDYYIVYSVLPLRIFKVEDYIRFPELRPVFRGLVQDFPANEIFVKDKYSTLDEIEKSYVYNRDLRGIGIFRGGTRGIEFGGEHLFVDHITLSKQRHGCFPSWFLQKKKCHGVRTLSEDILHTLFHRETGRWFDPTLPHIKLFPAYLGRRQLSQGRVSVRDCSAWRRRHCIVRSRRSRLPTHFLLESRG